MLHLNPVMYTENLMVSVGIRQNGILTLLRPSVGSVNPMPRANASSRRAGRHRFGNLEDSVPRPNTGVVDAEYRQVRGPDLRDVALVRNRQSAALGVALAGGVELENRRAGARVVGEDGVLRLAPCRPGFAAGNFEVVIAPGHELINVSRVGRVCQVAVLGGSINTRQKGEGDKLTNHHSLKV